MRNSTSILLIIVATILNLNANPQFDDYFFDKTLRIDYYHVGNSQNEEYFFKEMIQEPFWGGSKNNLIDNKQYGVQMVKLFDQKTDSLIYSLGFCTLFNEWQTTVEAKSIQKGYPEALVIPFPRAKARVEIWARDSNNVFVKKWEHPINPDSHFIRKSKTEVENWDIVYNGNHAQKVDIVVLAEGYSAADKDLFRQHADRFAAELLSYSPLKECAKQFNIRAVWQPSAQSGGTLPGENIWKNTALSSSYYTFDSERYLMVDDFQSVRDLAANVPYDYIYILSNTKKYGGGGIFNFYAISAAADPSFAGKVYVHEFGHLIVGLADEYVGTTGYDEFYNKTIEPWEENITTLVNFEDKIWSKMLPKGTKIPTTTTAERVLGVYEGGGYQREGVYRPWQNCLMRDLHVIGDFCPVCTKTIKDRIDYITK